MSTVIESDLLKISEVMEILRCSRDTVYRLMREEGLPYEQYPGRRLVSASQLQDWRQSILVNGQASGEGAAIGNTDDEE